MLRFTSKFNFSNVIFSVSEGLSNLSEQFEAHATTLLLETLSTTRRLRAALIAQISALVLFGLTTAPTFAQTTTTGTSKVKDLGNKLLHQLGGMGLTIAAIGFVGIVILGFVMITFSGMFKREWKQRAIQGIMWGAVGIGGLALVSLIVPAIFDLINGLGGEQLDTTIGTGK